jgi:putative transposase
MRYLQYFNKKKNKKGHLWQGRFYSCILDERHLYGAVRYVENNPVRAAIVKEPHEHRWSSAKAHVSGESALVLRNDCYLVEEIKDWLSYLMEKDDKTLIENIKSSTRTGRPCGDEVFIQKIENLLDRRLNALPKGRPRRRE